MDSPICQTSTVTPAKPGDFLIFVKIVDHTNKMEDNGEVFSLSGAAQKILKLLNYRTTSVSGPEYWMINGETLDERRRRMEEEQFGG
ncbi:hypothetical protein HHS34_007260 [Acidithiobacillus montserratensis]|uniref:Uncharacterized protein n=1 Tax=Acidithiobacillus montserratensis TaxID=2729135 RepID=A0ACD5HB13_9PROT|nr:hypothetical protein [Acidithiobacillus montserratensis]MBU2748253.1 hypothetical protein [Acidithiobacillus montserratensis]